MTAGQTVVFSATIIVAALACLLIMPQGFLKSVAYGAIASVSLAALLSITVLPAILGILGPRIDALNLPFLRRTKTKQEIEDGFWGRLAGWVMRRDRHRGTDDAVAAGVDDPVRRYQVRRDQ